MHPSLWSYTATLVATLMSNAAAESSGSSTGVATRGTTVERCTDEASRVDPGPEDEPQPWIHRFAPRRKQVELGVYVGALLLSPDHELYQADPAQLDGGYEPLGRGAGTVGGRLSSARRRKWLALELQGGVARTHTAAGASAIVWHAGGSVVGQVARWSVVPFVLAGVGAVGISSKVPGSVGRDIDAAVHVGGGVKVNLSHRFMVRLDVHDIVAARRGVDNGVAHNYQVLLGASVLLGRRPEE